MSLCFFCYQHYPTITHIPTTCECLTCMDNTQLLVYKIFLKTIDTDYSIKNPLNFETFCQDCWKRVSLLSCPLCLVKYKFYKSKNYNNLYGSLASSAEQLDSI